MATTADRALLDALVQRGTSIDLARVRAVVAEFVAALEEPQRLAQFDALVRRSGGAGQ